MNRCGACGGCCGGGYTTPKGNYVPCKYGIDLQTLAEQDLQRAAGLIQTALEKLHRAAKEQRWASETKSIPK